MTTVIFTTAFSIGAIAVSWMGIIFMETNLSALAVTLIIGCIYGIGVMELVRFRRATRTLSAALETSRGSVSSLDAWLGQLDMSLKTPVRRRIEGEQVGLPAPVLSPYFIGLLVMLGLLGTFAGMVDTLKGAVAALEGTTDIQAIRTGLAAPMKGLGFAFGTSVAGVAASAMLGLMSTLSRRDRILASRRLDAELESTFKDFSLRNRQQITMEALQAQTEALPEVAERLMLTADRMDRLSDRLISNQDAFHASTRTLFTELATSLNQTHAEYLTESIRQAGAHLKPMLAETLGSITSETQNAHHQLSRNTRENLEQLSERMASLFASHMTRLAEQVEIPLSQLLEAAKTAPEAATDLMEKMRLEVSRHVERDTKQLEEQRRILNEIEELTQILALNSGRQSEAVTQLIESSRHLLNDVSHQFNEKVDMTTSRLATAGEDFTVSAVEMASLGEAFAAAVDAFRRSNENMIESLAGIEASLDKTTTRSDEQLQYYIDQAREIIDHCMLSQKGIFEELQQLRTQSGTGLEAGEWKN